MNNYTLRRMLDWFLPKRCSLCARRGQSNFCADCQPLLPWNWLSCEICGAELREAGVCGSCQARPPYYDHSVIPFKYRAPVAGHIQILKYHNQLRYASSLGAMICQHARERLYPLPEVLIPIPLHHKRLRQRGFNQSLEIARAVGKELDIKIEYSSLERIKNTVSQTGLSENQRRKNMRGAFQATRLVPHTHVALLDDVVTTGSTINAAARALKKAGVKTISVWAAAKA